MDFSIARDDVLHVQKKHGDAAAEAARGQVAMTMESYQHLPAIVSSPDSIVNNGTSDIGEPLVIFEKVIGKLRYFAVFAVRRGRRTLGLKTFYSRSV